MESLEEQLVRYQSMPPSRRDFVGTYEGILQDRNRLSIPKEFRDIIDLIQPSSGIVAFTLASYGFIPVIQFMPEIVYNQRAAKVSAVDDLKLKADFAGSYYIRKWDGQGRLLIPQRFLNLTHIQEGNDIYIIGCNETFIARAVQVDHVEPEEFVRDVKE